MRLTEIAMGLFAVYFRDEKGDWKLLTVTHLDDDITLNRITGAVLEPESGK